MQLKLPDDANWIALLEQLLQHLTSLHEKNLERARNQVTYNDPLMNPRLVVSSITAYRVLLLEELLRFGELDTDKLQFKVQKEQGYRFDEAPYGYACTYLEAYLELLDTSAAKYKRGIWRIEKELAGEEWSKSPDMSWMTDKYRLE